MIAAHDCPPSVLVKNARTVSFDPTSLHTWQWISMGRSKNETECARSNVTKRTWNFHERSGGRHQKMNCQKATLTDRLDSVCYRSPATGIGMDHIDTDRLAVCPGCGAPMRFSRTVPLIGGLPEMQTFECRRCHLAVTAEQVLQFAEFAELKPVRA